MSNETVQERCQVVVVVEKVGDLGESFPVLEDLSDDLVKEGTIGLVVVYLPDFIGYKIVEQLGINIREMQLVLLHASEIAHHDELAFECRQQFVEFIF